MTSDEREARVRAREEAATARESAADSREIALEAREELADTRASREQLLLELREANERLVAAVIQADEAQDAASYNELRFRSLVTTSAAIVWHANAAGDVEIDSESWRAFTGLTPSEIDRDLGWLHFVPPRDRDRVRDAWQRAVADGTPFACEHQIAKHGGEHAWVESRAVPIRVSGVLREWIGMMTDVTDRVRMEEARDQFIGILGHDLRNPLTAISVGVEALAQLLETEPYTGVVSRIARSARRMDVIIRDVMDFARGRLGGGIPVSKRACDLGKIASEVTSEMSLAHPRRDIQLETSGDLSGLCDVDRVEQVLSNLLGNAVAHGEDPIRVVASDEGDHVMITVSNRGAPIPAAAIPRLFEPFSRGFPEADSRDGRDGLGLGLYIANEIVRAHGGTITVSSSGDQGTSFSVEWPRAG